MHSCAVVCVTVNNHAHEDHDQLAKPWCVDHAQRRAEVSRSETSPVRVLLRWAEAQSSPQTFGSSLPRQRAISPSHVPISWAWRRWGTPYLSCAALKSRPPDLTMLVRQWYNATDIGRLSRSFVLSRETGFGCAVFRVLSRAISNPGGRLLSLAAVPLVSSIRGRDPEKLRRLSRTESSNPCIINI